MLANVIASFCAVRAPYRSANGRSPPGEASSWRAPRPRALPLDVRERIGRARRAGTTYAAIADALNRDGVPHRTRCQALAALYRCLGVARRVAASSAP